VADEERKAAEDCTYYLVEGHIKLKRRQGGIRAQLYHRAQTRNALCPVHRLPFFLDKDRVTLNYRVCFRSSSDAEQFMAGLSELHHFGLVKGQVTVPDRDEKVAMKHEPTRYVRRCDYDTNANAEGPPFQWPDAIC
jgi:hypothetical protein